MIRNDLIKIAKLMKGAGDDIDKRLAASEARLEKTRLSQWGNMRMTPGKNKIVHQAEMEGMKDLWKSHAAEKLQLLSKVK